MLIACPNCGKKYQVAEANIGRRFQCDNCQQAVLVEAPQESMPPLPREHSAVVAPPAHRPESAISPAAARPPKLPPLRKNTAMDSIVTPLVDALSWQKIVLAVGGFLVILLCTSMILLSFTTGDLTLIAASLLVIPILVVGLLGVIAGGIAYLAHAGSVRQPESLRAAWAFCGRRFLSLFASLLIVLLGTAFALLVLNLPVAILNRGGSVGTFLAALLFLPQVLGNVVLVLASFTAVLVPCVLAVDENTGFVEAIKTMVHYLRHNTRNLLVQTWGSMLCTGQAIAALAFFALLALAPAWSTNGPDVTGGIVRSFSSMMEQAANEMHDSSGPSGQFNWGSLEKGQKPKPAADKGPAGDSLRYLSVAIMIASVLGAVLTYWVCASLDSTRRCSRWPLPRSSRRDCPARRQCRR